MNTSGSGLRAVTSSPATMAAQDTSGSIRRRSRSTHRRLLRELAAEGLTMLDEQQPLGIVVGMQLVGARTVTWDLWGDDIDEAFAELRKAAMGGDGDMLLGGGLPPGF